MEEALNLFRVDWSKLYPNLVPPNESKRNFLIAKLLILSGKACSAPSGGLNECEEAWADEVVSTETELRSQKVKHVNERC